MIKNFKENAINAHGLVYNYDKTEYIDEYTEIQVECTRNNHGIFKVLPKLHLMGERCPKCKSSGKKTNEQYINEANITHDNLFSYSKLVYKNNRTPVIVTCKIHGDFKINPYWHLKGGICPECDVNSKKSNKIYIKQVSKVHNNFYDYSKTIYITARDTVIITCPEHGDFSQIARDHLNGHGCKKCKKSLGELKIMKWLENRNIIYEDEKKFKKCRDKRELPFDFYLPSYNVCIEYNGKQHFEPIDYFGGNKTFESIKARDLIKDKYCLNNSIKLIRIPYWEFNNIEFTLENELNL